MYSLPNDPEVIGENRFEPPPGWLWPILGLAVVLSFPYYFSLETFFSHDDFAILWFHKDWPIWQPWRFLDVHVLTFYRPLQSYTLAVLFHFFGMTPFPYCLVLVSIHLTNVVLFGRLIDRLFNDRSLAFLSVIFFAANWEYCDVVYWKGNYGTALSWLFVLASGNAFLDHLRTRRTFSRALSYVLAVAALLSKETAANVPIVFTLMYGMYLWRPKEARDALQPFGEHATPPEESDLEPLRRPKRALLQLGPFYALAGAYAVFYRYGVKDVYVWLPKGYELAPPAEMVHAVAHAATFWLVWWFYAGVEILTTGPAQLSLLRWLHRGVADLPAFPYYVLPLLLVVASVALRNRRLLCGLLWAVVAFLPANLIAEYHTPRYYYGSLMGIALVYAEIFLSADRAIARRATFEMVAFARVIGALLILAFVATSMFLTTSYVGGEARRCRQIENVYRYLVSQRGRFPSKTLYEVGCLNQTDHFHYGMGVREMFKLALHDDEVEAVLPGQPLTTRTLAILHEEYPRRVRLERLHTGRFRLREIGGPATETPSPSSSTQYEDPSATPPVISPREP